MVYLDEGQEKIIDGFNKVVDAAKTTLGGCGGVVIIKDKLHPKVTADGVTVIKQTHLECPIENLGVELAKEVAVKTVSECEDGTTSSCVLAQAIINGGKTLLDSGESHVTLKDGIEKAKVDVLKELKKLSKPAEKRIRDIAFTASNADEELTDLIVEAYKSLSIDGLIEVVETDSKKTELVITEGMRVDSGWLSPYLVTDKETLKTELSMVNILLFDGTITNGEEHLKKATDIMNAEGSSLLIICDEISDELANIIIEQKLKNKSKICVIKNPYFGKKRLELLEDIAAFTAGEIYHPSQSETLVLGKAQKVIIGEETTSIQTFERTTQVVERITLIQKQLVVSPDDRHLQRRLANLSNNSATLYIGGQSTSEISEKKDRADDATGNLRNALSEGCVAGAGSAFYHIAHKLRNPKKGVGYNLLLDAIEAPLIQILENAGLRISKDGEKNTVNVIPNYKYLYNVREKRKEKITDTNVLDSTKVQRVALENAVSVSVLILSTKAVIE